VAKKRAVKRGRYGDGSIKTFDELHHELRYYTTATDGSRKRHYKKFRGTYAQAVKTLRTIVQELGEDPGYVPVPPITFGRHLLEYMESKKGEWALRTYETYKSAANLHVIPALGHHMINKLRTTHLKAYFEDKAYLSPQARMTHHILINSSLKVAVAEGMIRTNPATALTNKPRVDKRKTPTGVLQHCWKIEEVKQFLKYLPLAGLREAAMYSLALDTGEREGALLGHFRSDYNAQEHTIRIERSIVKVAKGGKPIYAYGGKDGMARTLRISPTTCYWLDRCIAQQAVLRASMGEGYIDYGLLFAQEDGKPLPLRHIDEREFQKLTKTAGVRAIKFHGMRHTCATLLLEAGVPIHQVSARLGHKDIVTTLRYYAHAIPTGERTLVSTLDKLYYDADGTGPAPSWMN